MKTIRQILRLCIVTVVGWTLASTSFAQGPTGVDTLPRNVFETQVRVCGWANHFPLGWWQAEPPTDSVAEVRLRKRLVFVAIVTSGVIAILALLFAYLRMEYITRGFYSGRLQFLAVALTVVVIAVCYLAWISLGK